MTTHALDKAPTHRQYDLNGWFEVKSNPLSKVGIFDYSGAQIGAPAEDADKIFRVFRPAEELGAADTVDSFKLVPFIDDHTMLGDGFTSTDDRPPSGVIGEGVRFEGDTLYGNVKVYSKALAEKIKSGKTEISMGYRCRYDFTPGVWDGKAYDVVQRDLRGNHVALVDEGRMGPEVSILDHLTFAVDAKELKPVEKLDEILAALAALTARLDALEADKAPAGDEDTPDPVVDAELDDPEIPPAAADTDPAEVAEKAVEVAALADDLHEIAEELNGEIGTDAKLQAKVSKIIAGVNKIKARAAMDSKTLAKMAGKLRAAQATPAMDERAIVDMTAKRSSLVDRLSKHIGTFDHAKMTTAEIADYGIQKLGIKGVTKGHETVALDAYLQAKADPTSNTTVAQDKAPSALASKIAGYGQKAE